MFAAFRTLNHRRQRYLANAPLKDFLTSSGVIPGNFKPGFFSGGGGEGEGEGGLGGHLTVFILND